MSSQLFIRFLQKRTLELKKQQAPLSGPPRPGLQWKPSTHRWIRPKDTSAISQAPQASQPAKIPTVKNIKERLRSKRLDGLIESLDLDPNKYYDKYDIRDLSDGKFSRDKEEEISSHHFSNMLRNKGDFPRVKKGHHKYFPKRQVSASIKSAVENVTGKLKPGMDSAYIQKLMIADMLGLDETSISTDPRFETPTGWKEVNEWGETSKFGGFIGDLGKTFTTQLKNQANRLAKKVSQIGVKKPKKKKTEGPVFTPNPAIDPNQPNKYTDPDILPPWKDPRSISMAERFGNIDRLQSPDYQKDWIKNFGSRSERGERIFALHADSGYGMELKIGDKVYDIQYDLLLNTRLGRENAKEIGVHLGLDSEEALDEINIFRDMKRTGYLD